MDMDRVGQIKGVLRTFEAGADFEAAAKLADAMLRDDRIYGCLSTRVDALVASTLECKGATTKRRARQVADEIGGSDQERGKWWSMFPYHAISELLEWGIMLGIGVAEIVWDTTDPDEWAFTIRCWHPQFLKWDVVKSRYYLLADEGRRIDLPSTEDEIHSDGKWIIYTPYGYRNVWRRALMRPLAMLYLARQWTMRDWSRYSEKHGHPTDVVEIPEGMAAADKTTLMQSIAARGSEAAIFFPISNEADAAKPSLQLVEAVGRSHESFKMFLDKIEADIAICIKGQNLTTEVKGGSFAAAAVHEGVDLRVLMKDAGVTDTLVGQAIWHWVVFNKKLSEKETADILLPRCAYVVEPPDDELKEAQTIEAVGAAVTACQLAGVDVNVEAMVESFGIPVHPPEDADDDATAAPGASGGGATLTPSAFSAIVTVNEARAAGGYGPLMDGEKPDPDGTLTVAEFMTKNAAVVAGAAQAEAGKKPGDKPAPVPGAFPSAPGAPDVPTTEPPDDGTPQRPNGRTVPRAEVDTLSGGVARIHERARDALTEHLSTRPAPGIAGHRRTAKYAEALERLGQRRAAQAMAPDLKTLMGIIDKTADGPDWAKRLKRAVAKAYPRMNGAALARVVERTMLMGHMSGRLGALEEI